MTGSLAAGALDLQRSGDGPTERFTLQLDGRTIGTVVLQRLSNGVGELTWRVDTAHRRRGHGTSAVRTVLRWAFGDGGLARVQVHLDPADVASTALAVACGLRREGVLRGLTGGDDGGRRDVLLHAMVRADQVDDVAELRWGAVRAGLPTKAVAAGILARNRRGDALVVETSYKAHWEVPGGLVETGEGLVAATRRELAQELGVAWPVGDLLVVDCCPTVSKDHDIVCLLFDGGVHDEDVTESFTFPDGEIVRAHWADDVLLDRCSPRLSTRVRTGLAALRTGVRPVAPVMLRGGVFRAG